MDLHAQIMNIPVGTTGWAGNDHLLYKKGHRDARHAAAELALAVDARVKELEEALQAVSDASASTDSCLDFSLAMDRIIDQVRAALKGTK